MSWPRSATGSPIAVHATVDGLHRRRRMLRAAGALDEAYNADQVAGLIAHAIPHCCAAVPSGSIAGPGRPHLGNRAPGTRTRDRRPYSPTTAARPGPHANCW